MKLILVTLLLTSASFKSYGSQINQSCSSNQSSGKSESQQIKEFSLRNETLHSLLDSISVSNAIFYDLELDAHVIPGIVIRKRMDDDSLAYYLWEDVEDGTCTRNLKNIDFTFTNEKLNPLKKVKIIEGFLRKWQGLFKTNILLYHRNANIAFIESGYNKNIVSSFINLRDRVYNSKISGTIDSNVYESKGLKSNNANYLLIDEDFYKNLKLTNEK